MPNLTAPPAPSWYGMPADLVTRYTAFMRQRLINQAHALPEKLRMQLEHTQRRIDSSREEVSSYRETVNEFRRQITEIESRVMPTEQDIEQEIANLLELPEVIGTRIDHLGQLIVLLRLTKEIEGVVYDAGDVELRYDAHLIFGDDQSLAFTALRRTGSTYVSGYGRQKGDLFVDYLPVGRQHDVMSLLSRGQITEVTQLFIERMISEVSRYFSNRYDIEKPPERPWENYLTSPAKAALRVIEKSQADRASTLESLRSNLERYQGRLTHLLDSLRSYQAEARATRAELARLEALPTVVDIDTDTIRRELWFITHIPGMMGVRFEADGTPVFHLRTSHELDGKRFDMGDYEVKLTRNTFESHAGVVGTKSTRQSGRSAYWHPELGRDGWFCFGNRASEIIDHFESNEIGLMLHLIVNGMNAINHHDNYVDQLRRQFPEIPIDAVWVNRPKQRPRRRPRNQQKVDVRTIGRMAMQAFERVAG
ncbi:MAG: hypothetical protein ACOH18_03845 [Candidatus Saccharimonadaceae bacterium]